MAGLLRNWLRSLFGTGTSLGTITSIEARRTRTPISPEQRQKEREELLRRLRETR